MHDAFAMCRIERVGNLNSKQQCVFRLQLSPSDTVLQRHAVEKLHDHEGTSGFLADVVNRADVGMVQSGSSFSLSPEAA